MGLQQTTANTGGGGGGAARAFFVWAHRHKFTFLWDNEPKGAAGRPGLPSVQRRGGGGTAGRWPLMRRVLWVTAVGHQLPSVHATLSRLSANRPSVECQPPVG